MVDLSYSRFYVFLSRRWWAAFILLGISFVLGGLVTLNLLHTLSANVEFVTSYGFDALREGGFKQLIEIVVSGYFAAACYLVFKLCEKVLVERLATIKNKDTDS